MFIVGAHFLNAKNNFQVKSIFSTLAGMFETEFEEKFNPWNSSSLDDFLYYCCPECDNKTKTKGDFLQHAKTTHSRSQNIIHSYEANQSQELIKAVTEFKNEECPTVNSNESHIFAEAIDIEETKPEPTDFGFVTKVNYEIIKVESVESNIDPNERSDIPPMKKVVLSLPKLSDKIIQKYTKNTEVENFNCQRNIAPNEDLPIYQTNANEKNRYKCDECDKSFSRKAGLNIHIKCVHENVRHNCDKCDKSFTWKSALNTHIQIVHENVLYNCDKCDKHYPRKHDLIRHIKHVHKNVRYNCDQCDKNYVTKSALNRHIESIHEDSAVQYKCQKCQKKFLWRANLISHIKRWHENVRHNCDKCDKSFTWKSALNTHIQIVHENVLYDCDKCDKNFYLKTHLKQHMKKVHEEL